MNLDAVAQIIVNEAKARKYTREECLAVMSALYQESSWNETIWDPTHVTYGVAQQDGSYPDRFKGAAAQVKGFFDKLDIWRKKPGASTDIWLNICWMQQRPNWPSAQHWVDNGRKAYLTEIQSRITTVRPFLNRYWPEEGTLPVSSNRPDFNEINEIQLDWNGNGYNHASPRSRPPINWLVHTQEGNGNATDLSAYLRSTGGKNAVSYHYTIHEDPKDHGVTVVDVCDTDYYSWSVLDANVFSINACFAGSRAAMSTDEWMSKYKNAIRVAAYLAVEDCKKYTTLSSNVILPPYQSGAGISDHRYVTECLGIGNHTDVGGPMRPPWTGFPWQWMVDCVHEFNSVPVGAPPVAVEPTTDQLIRQIAADAAECRAQLGTGHGDWASKGMTLRDKVWSIAGKVGL